MPPTEYDRAAWVRLGRVVYTARNRRGLSDTQEWASAVGRSTRVVLGLERGEPAGRGTLARIETALNWPDQHAYRVLDSETVGDVIYTDMGFASVSGPETVSPTSDALADVRYRRPEGMGDEQWATTRAKLDGYFAALLDQAETER